MIAIGCIVRNRGWILPEYLTAISRIDYPDKTYIFLENDSCDNTVALLEDFVGSKPGSVLFCKGFSNSQNDWHRNGYWKDGFHRLANIRNCFFDRIVCTGAEYLLSVDSDIIVEPDLLNKLLIHADQNTIVGGVISNVKDKKVDGTTPCNFMCFNGKEFVHPKKYPISGVMDVDMIGAVYLIPVKAITDGVRYEGNPHGEDIGFCINAKKHGFKIKAVFDAVCDHRMIDKSGV